MRGSTKICEENYAILEHIKKWMGNPKILVLRNKIWM